MDKLLNIINSGKYEKIEGWCSREKAIKMASYVNKNSLCVELGVFGGRSLLPLCLMTDNKVFGIDAWNINSSLEGENSQDNYEWWSKINYNDMFQYTKNLINKYKCNNCKLLRMNSYEAVGFFENESIDVLHQDSNHSEKISCLEVELYDIKVKPGGIWIFDDTNWETTKKAQEKLLEKGYLLVENYETWCVFKKPL
jgi:hypothetical protein